MNSTFYNGKTISLIQWPQDVVVSAPVGNTNVSGARVPPIGSRVHIVGWDLIVKMYWGITAHQKQYLTASNMVASRMIITKHSMTTYMNVVK